MPNSLATAQEIVQLFANHGVSSKIIRIDPQYMMFDVANKVAMTKTRNILELQGFRETDLDTNFNRNKGDAFCVRRGIHTAIVRIMPVIGVNGVRVGKIGNVFDAASGAASKVLDSGAQSAADAASLPGKLANTAAAAADNLEKAQKTALDTATFGFDLGVKVVLGTAILFSAAVMLPKIVNSFAGTYDEIRDAQEREVERKQKRQQQTGVIL